MFLMGILLYLRVMTCKARKINKLFGYEYDLETLKKINGIGWDMIHRVTCSADSISRLTNLQIRYIIDQVNSKTVNIINDQSHVTKNSPLAEERANEEVQAEEGYLASLGIFDEDVDIKIFDDEPSDSNHSITNVNVDKTTVDIDFEDIFSDEPVDSNHSITNANVAKTSVNNFEDTKIFDDSSEKEIARIKALEDNKNTPPIKIFDDEDLKIFDDLFPDEPVDSNHPITNANVSVDIDFKNLKIFDDNEPIDSNHPTNARSEGISVQA